jgi:hypothetical protein
MILYYREIESGDYLCADHSTKSYYLRTSGDEELRQCRATAITKEIGSVCTCTIFLAYLRTKCKRVPKSKVPKVWLRVLDGPQIEEELWPAK